MANPYHKSVEDVDFLIDEENRKLLIYVDLKLPWYRINPRKKQRVFSFWVIDSLEKLIPEFDVKVTFNREKFYNLISLVKGEPKIEKEKE